MRAAARADPCRAPAANNIRLHSESTIATLRNRSDNSQVTVAATSSTGSADSHSSKLNPLTTNP
jgi:hypothetical protein